MASNWQWFCILTNLALKALGRPYSRERLDYGIGRIEEYYDAGGWYHDGNGGEKDYYNPFVMVSYGLLYAMFMEKEEPDRCARYRERAREFARDYLYWFAPDGASIAYGRSLTYRFAQGAFWAIALLAGEEVLPLPVVKGLLCRHLAWWLNQPIYDNAGVLTIGYAYPNLQMSETYNAPGSPYWALKCFAFLALPDGHPFWTAECAPLPALERCKFLPHANMLVQHGGNNAVALVPGRLELEPYAHTAEKYSKFAYSSRFGFSIARSNYELAQMAPDSSLCFKAGRYYYQRDVVQTGFAIGPYGIETVWSPLDGIRVTTWIEPVPTGHIRTHTIESEFECGAYDSGFAVNNDDRLHPSRREDGAFAEARCGADYEMAPQPAASLWRGRADSLSRTAVPGGVLLDFGRERTGTLHAKARGTAGERLTLRFGEELDGQGRVRYDMRCNCRYEECWTLTHGESVLHQFDYKAFRYVEILGDAALTECWVWERHYPMEDSLCTLSCKADQLEDIFAICKNAVRCGSQEGYLDCPTREKGQYLGDAIVTARSHVWLTGKTGLLRKCIGDFMASAEITPSLLGVAPGSLRQEVADFSLLFPLLPLTDWDFTGDREFLRACLPAVNGIGEVFARYRRPDGLLENVSHSWNLVDWPEESRDGYDFPLTRPVAGEGCHNVINALWYGFLTMKEKIEGILSLPVTEESRRVGEAFRNIFYRPSQRLFADSETSAHCSLHANLYAACFGLTPDADAYTALLETPGRFCGPLPMYFALRGLDGFVLQAPLGRHLLQVEKRGVLDAPRLSVRSL